MKVSKDALRAARSLFRATLDNGKVDLERAKTVVNRLSEEKPRNYLGILTAYARLLRLELGKRHVHVESAVEISDDLRNEVLSGLKRKFGDDLTSEFSTNPGLLGGMRVKLGSDVWDGSVRSRIDRLAESL